MSPFMTANGRLPTVFSRHRVLLTLVILAIAVVVGLIWRMPKQSAG